eukprot:CAMPEP_0201735310 /NCGR_PEP_ID=MMETSP0593-20130828/36705_1 /ASSEMBLY_ACC=CAM_ASM_000672 /TAXON_ID=267983 /ORGANISM="Skeletonema japonicum, Strain CCMP2506" /LENGTH=570 /DNA_ID=CAMNT_0048228837 /DNA_START=9 /DNA_END=1721 /DNA_ORIENTATION=-
MAISIVLFSVLLVEVASFHLSGTSSSNPHIIVSSLPGQLLQPRQHAPLFASSDDEEVTDSSTTTFATAPQSIGEKVFAELDNMRKQFAVLTESLTMAKEREEQAKGDVTRLTDEKKIVDAEMDSVITGKKRVLSEEMTDLSDQLEGAQDSLRKTMLKTRSEISSIQDEARQSEKRLKNEIVELESRLQSLRDEAEAARKDRDEVIKQIESEEEEAWKKSRQEIEEEKKASFAERKAIKYNNWDMEGKIRQFTSELPSAEAELKKEEEATPNIPTMKETLESMKKKMNNSIDDLKDQRRAKEITYEQNLSEAKADLTKEMDVAKSVFEKNMVLEEEKLDQSITDYEKRLVDKENELLSNLRLATERADRVVANAIKAAKNNRIALYQEKLEAVQSQRNDRLEAMEDAVKTREAVQDLYDAEYEDEIYNLKKARATGKQKLDEEDIRRDNQKRGLIQEMEDVTQQLSQQLSDEKTAGEIELRTIKDTKSAELAGSRARTTQALNEIGITRSNLVAVRDELRRLETSSKEKSLVLEELEEERSSFRKQFRRTMVVAVDKMTLKKLRNKRRKIE